MRGNKDGVITKAEWFYYYTDLSNQLSSDEYFVQMLENTWGICEHEDTKIYQRNVEEYLRLIKQQLNILLGKHNTRADIVKVFHDFDLYQTGCLTIDEFANMLA